MARGEDARDVTVDNTTGCTGCSVVASGGDGDGADADVGVSAGSRKGTKVRHGVGFEVSVLVGGGLEDSKRREIAARCDWLASMLAVLS